MHSAPGKTTQCTSIIDNCTNNSCLYTCTFPMLEVLEAAWYPRNTVRYLDVKKFCITLLHLNKNYILGSFKYILYNKNFFNHKKWLCLISPVQPQVDQLQTDPKEKFHASCLLPHPTQHPRIEAGQGL